MNNVFVYCEIEGTKVAEVVSDNVNAITRRTGRCPILV